MIHVYTPWKNVLKFTVFNIMQDKILSMKRQNMQVHREEKPNFLTMYDINEGVERKHLCLGLRVLLSLERGRVTYPLVYSKAFGLLSGRKEGEWLLRRQDIGSCQPCGSPVCIHTHLPLHTLPQS